MRTLKFRAWDGIRIIPYAAQDHMGRLKTSWEGHDTELVLMQYTGLKDSQGVEVYEGDILLSNTKVTTHLEVRWKNKWGRFVMVGFNKARRKEFELGIGTADLRTVIGNIYENPELLSDTNTPQGNER